MTGHVLGLGRIRRVPLHFCEGPLWTRTNEAEKHIRTIHAGKPRMVIRPRRLSPTVRGDPARIRFALRHCARQHAAPS